MTSFSPYFPLSEFQAVSDRALTAAEVENAAQLSQRLALIRHALGDLPVALTSFLRVGDNAQHGNGTAVDARRPWSVSWSALVEKVQALQHVGLTWGQFIIYPYENVAGRRHFHLSLPTGQARQAVLMQTAAGDYVPLTGALLASVPDDSVPAPVVSVGLAVAGGLAAAAALHTLGGKPRGV